jgi:hypothetical protein
MIGVDCESRVANRLAERGLAVRPRTIKDEKHLLGHQARQRIPMARCELQSTQFFAFLASKPSNDEITMIFTGRFLVFLPHNRVPALDEHEQVNGVKAEEAQ